MKHNLTQIKTDYIGYDGSPVGHCLTDDPIITLHRIHGVDTNQWPCFNALMMASLDHGLYPPSTMALRLATSCGIPLPQALATALNCLGESHGPVVQAARAFTFHHEDYIARMPRIPGFGHPIHTCDPRVAPLIEFCLNHLTRTRYVTKLMRVQELVEDKVHPNLAGAMAAVMMDCGWPTELTILPLIFGRMIGLTYHYREQAEDTERCVTAEKLKDLEL